MPSLEALVANILAFCGFEARLCATTFDFTLPRQDFADARQYTIAGDVLDASALLRQGGASEAAASALVASWAAMPRISAIQTIKQEGDQGLRTREFTLVQDSSTAWWIAPAVDGDAKSPVRIKTAAAEEIRDLLTGV